LLVIDRAAREGAVVHVVEGKTAMAFQWTGDGWKRIN
jgi:hypothetical protein